jgi:hypothetical protein
MAARDEIDAEVVDSPVYWFAILELAINHGNWEQAALAKRQLARLGVQVTHKRRPRGKEAKSAS